MHIIFLKCTLYQLSNWFSNVTFLKGISVPDIVPVEYQSENITRTQKGTEELRHPVTGTARHYVLGDCFHSITKPRKSLLCRYHDIDLCIQATALKSSYHESEKIVKKKLRLRSSTMQSFHVHFMYSVFMDFYRNKAIVAQQRENLLKRLKISDTELKRDQYLRFKVGL